MRLVARRLGLCLLFCVGVGCWSAAASQAFPETGFSASSAGLSPLGTGLVVPGLQLLDEGQQLQEQREAMLASPVAVAEREASRTRFSGLNAEQAAKLDRQVFPSTIERPTGGLQASSSVARITGFPSDTAASVVLSDGKPGLVESLQPIAVREPTGRRVPIDLGLGEAGGAFEPVSPLVAVRIPRRLGEGVQLGRTGVSLIPVGGSGESLGGSEGVMDGASIWYGNTQTDTDTVIKPTTFGFDAGAFLRSEHSPRQLAYRVVMPAGGRLVQDRATGAVRVLDGGRRWLACWRRALRMLPVQPCRCQCM